MSEFKIRFMPEDVTVNAASEEILLAVAARAGLHINASCGGEGVCGRCRVKLEEGGLIAEPVSFLSQDEYNQGVRLACRAKVNGDAVITIPEESRADPSAFKKESLAVETVASLSGLSDPMVTQIKVTVTPPSHDDNLSDLERVLAVLEATLGHSLEVTPEALPQLPKALRDGEFSLFCTVFNDPAGDGTLTVPKLIGFKPGNRPARHLGLAIDIGTTSVWARMVDLAEGRALEATGNLNAQIASGEDVISRIIFAGKGDGLAKLQRQVVGVINGLIDTLEKENGLSREDISLVIAAGNTTMTQLFLGLEPKYIRLAPYVPSASLWPTFRAADLGLALPPQARLKLYPCISSYVGGDIVAGVLASELYKHSELSLFIDVGTNGEIVVGNEDWQACAACSAGPAFEGGGVKFGMRAAPGAIEGFEINPHTLEHHLNVIGGEKPLGICGSGLISITAELFMAGVVDQQGKLNRDVGSKNIREGEDGWEYLLCPASESQSGRDLVLTELDIENLIRAKGAMYSGYQTLLENVGLSMGDLDKVIIGGGFGRFLHLEKAIAIGFLPELPPEKFSYIGNSSLTGATMAALSQSMWREALNLRRKTTNFELSETPGYMDYYMSSQFLPHTQKQLFPQTMEALAETRANFKR